jgi:hypothetical protein
MFVPPNDLQKDFKGFCRAKEDSLGDSLGDSLEYPRGSHGADMGETLGFFLIKKGRGGMVWCMVWCMGWVPSRYPCMGCVVPRGMIGGVPFLVEVSGDWVPLQSSLGTLWVFLGYSLGIPWVLFGYSLGILRPPFVGGLNPSKLFLNSP